MKPRYPFVTLLLVVSTAASALPVSAARRPVEAVATTDLAAPAPYPSHCRGWSNGRARSDALLANGWHLASHPVVTLPANRSWTENPLRDDNWQFQDHSLHLMQSVFATYAATGDARYLNRAVAVIRDWIADNPRYAARSIWAWNDHSTAIRAVMLACASTYIPIDGWLGSALRLHGQTLADPGFYRGAGNHALNQAIGLLEVAHVLRRSDWRTLAVDRLSALASASIDAQGVTNEQSVYYQLYNFQRYSHAQQRMLAMGIAPPASFGRLKLMPSFLAHATLPNGEYELIGDTERKKATAIAGTVAECAASQGQSGRCPDGTHAVYRAGYLFSRTGWGTARPFADETAMSLRWGPAPIFHGHADHGSITLFGGGSRLIVDPGMYSYNSDAYRAYFKGRTAHNIVTVDGISWNRSASSPLVTHASSAHMATATVRMTGNAGVTHIRNVVFSQAMGYVLVHDTLTSASSRVYRQLWHLTEDARPALAATNFYTRRARGNVQARQLIGAGMTSRVLSGRTNPIQGWLSWRYGERIPAPVVEFRRSGANVRFLTLLVPAGGTPTSSVKELRITANGYSAVISIGGRRERVVVNGSTVSVTPLN